MASAAAQPKCISQFQPAPARNTDPTKMDKAVVQIIAQKGELNPDGSLKEVMIDLSTIHRDEKGAFDVRVDSRISDRVEQLAAQFRDDPSRVPAIWVEYKIDAKGNLYFISIDGRHREEGAITAGLKQICACIFYNLTFEERRQLAMVNHINAALSHQKRDLKMNALELIKNTCLSHPADKALLKSSKNAIRELWAGKIPKEEIEDIIKWAARDYANLLLNCALTDARKGDITLKQAAVKWGASFKRLQGKMHKDGGKGRGDDPLKIGGFISTEFKSFHKTLHSTIGNLILDKQKGKLETEDVNEFFQQMKRLTGDLLTQIKEGEIKLRSLQYGD